MKTAMTQPIVTTPPTAPDKAGNMRSTRLLLLAGLLGLVVGVLFILVQPLFGMDPLTSRHAAAYQKLGGWSAAPAWAIAWFAHLAVSVAYGLMSGLLVITATRWPWMVLGTLAFGWVTTVIAPPANAIIVQWVSVQRLDLGNLPALNLALDEKFVLHLAFFAVITAILHAGSRRQARSAAPGPLARA